eukprot:XP_011676226.1 PREDICTED: uncharacterized protein LOC105444102 [Strongylocentrotus purpuratus]
MRAVIVTHLYSTIWYPDVTMPPSLGEWHVRIATCMRSRRKEYDYHYFWRKVHNLIKKTKNAEPPEENNNPECNISSRTGSCFDVNSSPGNLTRREDQSLVLSPKPRQDTARNTEKTTSSTRKVTDNHESPTYPVLRSGTSSGEADAIKGNDCPDMTNILLLRSGDVERNPGPNNNPGNLTDLELYLLAEDMDPSDFRKVGPALGFVEAQLSQFEKVKLGNSMQATYQMLYEWLKTVQENKARKILVQKLESLNLVQLADRVRKGFNEVCWNL